MKWFCFPQNISIFHWKPEQANQETNWNTSFLKGHHSLTPEVSSPSSSCSLLGTLPLRKSTFSNNALARQQCLCTPFHLHKRRILFIMEEATKSRNHQFICWVLQSSPPNSVTVEGVGKKKKCVKSNMEDNWAWILWAYSTAAAISCKKSSGSRGPSKYDEESHRGMKKQLSRKRGHSVLLSDSCRICQPAFRDSSAPGLKAKVEKKLICWVQGTLNTNSTKRITKKYRKDSGK